MSTSIPWWSAAIDNPIKCAQTTARDVWDALFGRMETFVRLEHDGSHCIVEPRDAWEFKGTAPDGDVYKTTEVHMTRRQFNNLPEFEGF